MAFLDFFSCDVFNPGFSIKIRKSLAQINSVMLACEFRNNPENGIFKIIYKRDAPLFAKLVKRFNLPQPEKTIIMDEIGTFVWRLIDGKKNTDEIIELFRKKYPLPRREAEVSIVAHLKNLMTRGAISIIIK